MNIDVLGVLGSGAIYPHIVANGTIKSKPITAGLFTTMSQLEDHVIDQMHAAATLRRGFAKMTTWQAFVVITAAHGISCREIARRCGVSTAAVSMARRRGLEILRHEARR